MSHTKSSTPSSSSDGDISPPLRTGQAARRAGWLRRCCLLAGTFLAAPLLAAPQVASWPGASTTDPPTASPAAPLLPDGPTTAPAPPAPPLRLVVNLPSYRLEVWEQGELTRTYPVTIGKPKERTPLGNFQVARAVWNPWWHPPYNRRPKDKVTPPGPRNPMGKVKLYFDSLYYLHGTYKEAEIGSPASRGCIRLSNADIVELAMLVHRYAAPEVGADVLDELASTSNWRTRTLPFAHPVPLEVRYEPVEVRDGQLLVHGDPYRLLRGSLAEQAARVLAAAGVPAEEVDPAALSQAVASAAPLAVPIESLRAAPAVPGGGTTPLDVAVAASPVH